MQFTKSTIAIFFTLLASVSAVAIPGNPGVPGGVTETNGLCDQRPVTHCCDTETKSAANGILTLGGLEFGAVCTKVDPITGFIPVGNGIGDLEKACQSNPSCCVSKQTGGDVNQDGNGNFNFGPTVQLDCIPVNA